MVGSATSSPFSSSRPPSNPFHSTALRSGVMTEIAFVPPPGFAASLHDLETAAYHLKYIRGRAAALRRGEADRDDVGRTQLARQERGNREAHRTVSRADDRRRTRAGTDPDTRSSG